MSRSGLIRGVAFGGVAALALVAPTTALAAGHGHAKHAKHATHPHHGKPAPKRFTATGTFDAADAGGLTFTMDDKGGSKDLHGKQGVVITVGSSTKVTLDDASSTLDKLAAGDHVTVNGTRGANGELDALHVNADSTPEPDASSSETPDVTSTETPAVTSTESPDPAVTATP